MLELAFPLVAALFGAALGSFLNVVIARAPRGESIISPPSHCPVCGHRLAAWENVPILSWVALRGRCYSCKAPISVRYVLVELATTALFALAAVEFGPTPHMAGAAILAAFAVVTLFVDLDHLLILDSVTYPVAAAGVLLAAGEGRALDALEGAVLGVVLFGCIYVATRGAGLGLGDVKLAGCLGVYLGLAGSMAAFGSAFVIGAVVAIPMLLARKRRAKDVLPLGPFLVLGALLVAFAPNAVFGPYAAYRALLYRHLGGP